MPHCLIAALVVFLSSGHDAQVPKEAAAKSKPSKTVRAETAPSKVLEALVRSFNNTTSKELQPLCTKAVQKALPPATMEAVFRGLRAKFGRIIDLPAELKPQGSLHVYRARGDRQTFYIKISFTGDGLLAGLLFVPDILENIPTTRLTLDAVRGRMQNAIEHTLYECQVPSISVALVKNDSIVWTKAFGYLNLAKSVPADAETAYITGSIFKVVVASAVMQLVDEGKLDLDAPVNRYLKNFQVPNPFEKKRPWLEEVGRRLIWPFPHDEGTPLTMRHLLSHRGGVPNGAQLVELWRRELPTGIDPLVRKNVKVVTRPGSKFEYSNYAYTFNGYLVGELSGTSIARALERRLFNPLHMQQTVFEPTPAICENLAIPYYTSGDGKRLIPASRMRLDVWPAGDVYSTPTDMARFLIMHLNNGKYERKQILSGKAVAEMARVQFAGKNERDGQGLGWMIDRIRGRRTLWHNGAVPGFYTQMAIDPAKKVGVVLFCNKFDTLGAALGVANDPLIDLRILAIELLDKLDMPNATALK